MKFYVGVVIFWRFKSVVFAR